MTARPARLFAAATTLLLMTGLAVAAPADAAKLRATTTAVSASRAVVGAETTLTATVTRRPSAGAVRFAVGAKTLTGCGRVAVRAGTARCTTRFATAGKRTVTARYTGTKGRYRASSGRRVVTVAAKPKPKPKPQPRPAPPTTRPVTPAAGSIVGGTGACTLTTGALVAVSFATWAGPVVRGCDTTPTKGNELLTTAKFTLAGTQHDGPAFLCRIGNPLFDGGRQYPTPSEDACVRTPPANAYWSYWLAAKGQNTWSYASLGAYSQPVKHGDVQAWTFGATDVEGTTGKPAFTPNQVRAGMSASRAAATRALAAPPASADLSRAVHYLATTRSANGVTDDDGEPAGSSLTEDGYYTNFRDVSTTPPTNRADFGLTIDGALALAAAGTDDATLRTIVTFLDRRRTDEAGRSVDDYTGIGTEYSGGGSVGKVALLAQVTGHDARDFSGHDLIAELDRLVCVTAVAGVCEADGNYRYAASTFSQALGVMAQLRAGDTAGAAAPLGFLQRLQRESGAFPSLIPGSDAEVDSTAMAAMALDLAGDREGVARALRWIASQQNDDGGFPGAAGNSTNSAALAAMGLTLAGSTYADEIRAADRFLAAQQNADGGFRVSAGGEPASDVRASTQVVSGLVGTPFTTLVDDVTEVEAPQPDAAGAADYLVDQLVSGDHLPGSGDFEDYGGTADVALALAASGTRDKTLAAIVRYLRSHVTDYADPRGANKDFPGPYGGQLAKLALVAEATGQDPRDFGGTDLLEVLTGTICTGPDPTNFTCAAAGDFFQIYSSTSQSLGVLVLARAGASVPPAAVNRLLHLQCEDGGFRSDLPPNGSACTSDVDSTGFAVQALSLLGTGVARDAVRNAIHEAVHYLRSAQNDNGSWDGERNTDSTNSAALAIQGLLAAPASADFPSGPGRLHPLAAPSDPQVKRARAFLAGRQNRDGGFGISPPAPASDVRATSQVLPAIAGVTLGTLSHPVDLRPSGPTTTPTSSGAGTGGAASGGSGPDAAGSPVAADAGGTADTGAPVVQLVGLALVLLLAGALIVAATRRRPPTGLAGALAGRHRRDR